MTHWCAMTLLSEAAQKAGLGSPQGPGGSVLGESRSRASDQAAWPTVVCLGTFSSPRGSSAASLPSPPLSPAGPQEDRHQLFS